jgi:16S rRNA processing protein RimM
MVTVGRIVRPRGNRGEVIVVPETDFGPDRFAAGEVLFIERLGAVVALRVASSFEQAGRWAVGFDGVHTIDEAETLRNQELRIPAESLRPLTAGRYYVHDLLGYEVRTSEGRRIGSIVRVELATGVPMLVAADRPDAAPQDEVLIPFTDAICRRVAPAERLIEIDPPDGLIELNRVSRR